MTGSPGSAEPKTLAAWVRRRLRAWPRQCEVCRAWSQETVCAACVARFAGVQPRCPRCALAVPGGRVCGECLHRPPDFEHAVVAVDYAFPWDALVTRFKFHAQPELAACLAQRMLAAIDDSPQPRPDVLLPVPLSAERLRQRGYNQAWELARHIGGQRGWAIDGTALVRGRDTPHQVGLTRAARTANLRDSLWVDPGAMRRVDGKRVAVVDDVMTTGATAQAAANALRRAGAVHIQVWVLARTPRAD